MEEGDGRVEKEKRNMEEKEKVSRENRKVNLKKQVAATNSCRASLQWGENNLSLQTPKK